MKAEQQSARWAARGLHQGHHYGEQSLLRLFGELAGAEEADRHLVSIERIRKQIQDVLASRKPSMANFEVALIAPEG